MPSRQHLGELSQTVLLFGGAVGNLQALAAMRQKAEELNIPPARTICLGDLAAYFADAEATTQAVRDWGVVVVAGNCEQSFAADDDDCGCGFAAGSVCDLLSREWHARSRQQLSADHKKWMRALPDSVRFVWRGIRFMAAHGAPSSVNKFVFPSTPVADKAAEIKATGDDAVIVGHSGIPFAQQTAAGWWLNPGSIGLPANDGTPDGWYALLQEADGRRCCRFCRLAYPWQDAQKAMLAHGINNGYTRALASGLWPSMDVLPPAERAQQGQALSPQRLTMV